MKIVHAYPGGPAENYRLVLVKQDGSKEFVEQTYDYFNHRGERIRSKTWKQREERVQRESGSVFEADVSLVKRFLADNLDVEIGTPSRVWIDCESDPRPGFSHKEDMRILVLCAIGDDGREFTGVLDEDTDTAEADLLHRFFSFIKDYTCVCAWNGGSSWGSEGFDFPLLRARVDRIWEGYSRKMNKWQFLDHLKAYRKLHLLFAESGEERSSYSLDNISKFVLGEGKHEYDAKNAYVDWAAGGSRRDDLVLYCARDVALLPRIEAHTGVLDLALEVARICGTLPDSSGLHATNYIDAFLLRLAGKRGLRLPTKKSEPQRIRQKFSGAFVWEPTARGIEKNIFSVDVSSMYPSVYIMLNASPETKGKPGCVSPVTGIEFAQEPTGVMPELLKELGSVKRRYKKLYKSLTEGTKEYTEAKQKHDAAKAVLNSAYGCGGSPYFRLFDKGISESITKTGEFCIKKIAENFEIKGYSILQGDTDSNYIKGATREGIEACIRDCNERLLPGIAAAHRCAGPPPVLEFDAAYERMVVLGKKKYVGRLADSEEYIVKGLEYRRGDASPLARKLQEQCVRKLMVDKSEDPEDFPALIIAMREHILHGELPSEEIILSESIRKDLADYEVTNPAVSAARIMQARGDDVSIGTRIRFVVIDGSVSPVRVIPASDYTGQADRYYYWENLVFPPTERLLAAAFPDTDWAQYSKVRPAKVRECAEKKYQAALERRGQMRIPGT